MREDNDSNVFVMITWLLWTSMSKKPFKLITHSSHLPGDNELNWIGKYISGEIETQKASPMMAPVPSSNEQATPGHTHYWRVS